MSKVETYLGSVMPLGSGDVQPSNSETGSYGENYKRQSESVETPTDQMKKYSICITHYNNVDTVRASLHSILSQIDKNFEVIVVDNFSNDGSFEVLSECARDGKITLIRERCSRGRGRQIAFENSVGLYIIANMDMDDLFLPKLNDFCQFYHEKYEGSMVRIRKSNGIFSSVTMAPRELIAKVGGWKDKNWYEDVDIWQRTRDVGTFVEVDYPLVANRGKHPERKKSRLVRLKQRYLVYREGIKIGYVREPPNWKQKPIYLVAKIVTLISKGD